MVDEGPLHLDLLVGVPGELHLGGLVGALHEVVRGDADADAVAKVLEKEIIGAEFLIVCL